MSLPVTAFWVSLKLAQGKCEYLRTKAICSLMGSNPCDPHFGSSAESCCILLPDRKLFCTQACPFVQGYKMASSYKSFCRLREMVHL